MIIVVKKSFRNTMYDLKVRMMVSRIVTQVETIEDFEEKFNTDIRLIPSMSAYSPAHTYLLTRDDNTIKVWHKNTNGIKDRLLFAVIFSNASFINI